MDPIPITSLAPETSPPADKSIRGIVTLFWPYSSSTRQCALLLADPDFRLRSRKGQVRVRFTGASAEAVARSQVGIGDEVVLGLNGAAWEEDVEATRTPGRSVDGELMFRRKLALRIARAGGVVDVNVDAPVSPPREPERALEVEILATPLPKPINGLRSSLEGAANGLPFYYSPAFAKRLRLSGQSFLDSAYDPFAGEDLDVDKPNKRQRTSFGGNREWRYAEKTPSPSKDTFEDNLEHGVGPGGSSDDVRDDQDDAHPPATMAPPPLSRLRMPEEGAVADASKPEHPSTDAQEAPSTPKLQPVKSPTLPLPSPFPTESAQPLSGLTGSATSMQTQKFGASAIIQDHSRATEALNPIENPGADAGRDVEMMEDHLVAQGPTLYGDFSNTEPDEEPDEDAQPTTNSIENPTVRDTHEARTNDDLADVIYEDDAEEIIDLSSAEPLSSEESDGKFSAQLDELSEEDEPSEKPNERNKLEEEHLKLSEQLAHEEPQTPQKQPLGVSALNGNTSTGPSPQVTPQSERDRIMARTFKSLFGFRTSPAVESTPRIQQPELESPTFPSGLSEIDQSSTQTADIHPEESQEPTHEARWEMPIPQAEASGETQTPAGVEDITISPKISERVHSLPHAVELHSEETQHAIPELQIESPAPRSEVGEVEGDDEQTAQHSQQPPPSSGRQSVTEVIDLGSSSEEEEEKDKRDTQEHEGSLTPLGPRKSLASPEIQDSLEDSKSEDLPRPRIKSDDGTEDASDIAALRRTERDLGEHDEMLVTTPDTLTVPERHVSPEKSSLASNVFAKEETASTTVDAAPEDRVDDTYDADEPSKSIAAATVIDIGSSSPVECLEGDKAVAGTDLFDDFIEADKPGSSPLDGKADHRAGEEEDRAIEPRVSSLHVDVTSIDDMINARAESQDQDVHFQPQAPQYPTLPLSPSNSQSLQAMSSQPAIESQIPETLRSMLPPTPQLTQAESSTQLQALVDDAATHTPQLKTPKKKSLTARLSNVPDVISDWFSPKRSSGVTVEESVAEYEKADVADKIAEVDEVNGSMAIATNGHTSAQTGLPHTSQAQTNGLATSLAYFTSLANLDELLNPSSQQSYGHNTIDVFAVVTDKTKEPTRAKSGPKDYFTIFRVSDSSLSVTTSVRVEVFRPWMAKLVVADVGDVVLLRNFAVKSRKRQAYLLSTNASAWCVWRYAESTVAESEAKKPVWARRKSSLNGSGVREEVKGPPVELGVEEREHAQKLREWWQADGHTDENVDMEDVADETGVNGHITQPMDAKL